MSNTWPGGTRRALSQDEHERWNAQNWPGTREICCKCGEATGRCEEESVSIDEDGPVCDECYDKFYESFKNLNK